MTREHGFIGACAECEGSGQMPTKDLYLGDGVYASFDGYGVVLDLRGSARSHSRSDPTLSGI